MSRRHRDPQVQDLPLEERRREARRVRHETRVMLAVTDPDDVALPTPVHRREHGRPSVSDSRRFRHWKSAFWKRRTALRHERNLAFAELDLD
ncbi:MAG TPA: hypothetical protein VHN98_06785 [Acidimicrobiales bacterium]|nr:hypothetical protein [Acidimicrobiales bacterium]